MKRSLWIIALTTLVAGIADADFLDDFSLPQLDPGWRVDSNDSTHWSLTARPGFLRIMTQYFDGNNLKNWFGHVDWIAGVGSYEVRAKLIARPDSMGQVGAIWTSPDTDFVGPPPVLVGLANAFSLKGVFGMVNDSLASMPYGDTLVYLRIRTMGDTFWTEFSPDNATWTVLKSGISRPLNGLAMSGLMAINSMDAGATPLTPEMNADYDWFYTYTLGVEEENSTAKSKIQNEKYKIHPNPFASFVSVPGHEREFFAVYDATGAQVGTYQGNRVGAGLAPGVYFMRGLDRISGTVKIVKTR